MGITTIGPFLRVESQSLSGHMNFPQYTLLMSLQFLAALLLNKIFQMTPLFDWERKNIGKI